MKRSVVTNTHGWMRLLLCLLIAAVRVPSAQSLKDDSTDIAQLRAEVRRLALELLAHRAELIQWKMQAISAELYQVQAERQRLAGERQSIEREISDLVPAATKGPDAEDEGRNEELKTVQLPSVVASERAVIAREQTLTAALGAENARLIEIQQRMQRLASEPTTLR